jgi:acetolactate synthase-1/2/3 large subunit
LVIQVDLDPAELQKGHPRIDVPLLSDADSVLRELSSRKLGAYSDWIGYIHFVKNRVPIIDPANVTGPGYVSPYHLVDQLAELLRPEDVIVPASSGSGQFVPMETFRLRKGQRVITNKGLASMGYGLAGAIGSALGSGSRVVLVEGDGSFSQSIQELGTLALNGWPVKIFLLDNDGYASIRTTQRNYFGGAYVGCDSATGLGFPDWILLARAFGIPAMTVGVEELGSQEFCRLMDTPGPAIFVVGVDPEQTYFPKVSSKLAKDGSMVSNPIHLMSPDLSLEVAAEVFRFRPDAVGGG